MPVFVLGFYASVSDAGGFAGTNTLGNGVITNSFWDTELSGQTSSNGGTGLISTEMKNISTYSNAGWDVSDSVGNATWTMIDGQYTPALLVSTVQVYLTDKTYDGQSYGSNVPSYNLTTTNSYFGGVQTSFYPTPTITGTLNLNPEAQNAINAGNYAVTNLSGLSSETHLLFLQSSRDSINRTWLAYTLFQD